jgi:hypothetical protein
MNNGERGVRRKKFQPSQQQSGYIRNSYLAHLALAKPVSSDIFYFPHYLLLSSSHQYLQPHFLPSRGYCTCGCSTLGRTDNLWISHRKSDEHICAILLSVYESIWRKRKDKGTIELPLLTFSLAWLKAQSTAGISLDSPLCATLDCIGGGPDRRNL